MVNWRRRHPDLPLVAGGTEVHPVCDRQAVVAWLLARDANIAVSRCWGALGSPSNGPR
ncbi:hypothetical protein [Streptomyces sp. NPDC053542]|uniref:hypothetical protein n=1 Tax=Streptomyces sp. NPDC053542 TaxID=3365710 RepID=UPI0037D71982